jgi:hypothetical protein
VKLTPRGKSVPRPGEASSRRLGAGVVVLPVLGLLAGLGWFLVTPSSYTAESRLAVGEQTVSTIQIPGYVKATEELASNYARYVEDTPDIRDGLPDGGRGVSDISASPIPDSSVIRVEVVAATESAAVRGVNAVSQQLLDRVATSGDDLDAAQQAFSDAYLAYSTAQAAADAAQGNVRALTADPRTDPSVLQAATTAADQAAAQAALLDLRQQALGATYRSAFADAAEAPTLSTIVAASTATADSASRLQRNLVIGLLAGAVLAAASVYLRRRHDAAPTGDVDGDVDGRAPERNRPDAATPADREAADTVESRSAGDLAPGDPDEQAFARRGATARSAVGGDSA